MPDRHQTCQRRAVFHSQPAATTVEISISSFLFSQNYKGAGQAEPFSGSVLRSGCARILDVVFNRVLTICLACAILLIVAGVGQHHPGSTSLAHRSNDGPSIGMI